VYIVAYVAGLALVLLMLGLLGERLSKRLQGLADPRGWFKKTLGVIFIILGIMIVFGIEKRIETALLDAGFFDVTQVEHFLLQQYEE
jgi:cytochrome c-type biogenesis protein